MLCGGIFSPAKIIHYHRSPPQRAERINQLKMLSNLPFLLKNNVFKNNLLSSRDVPKGVYCESLLKSSLGVGALISPLNPCLKKKIQQSEDKDILFVKTGLYDFYFFPLHVKCLLFYFCSCPDIFVWVMAQLSSTLPGINSFGRATKTPQQCLPTGYLGTFLSILTP